MTSRLYCTSSVLSTILASVHAKSHQTELSEVLIIDAIPIKGGTTDLMKRIAIESGFRKVIDLSIRLGDSQTDMPSARKQWTRKLKTKPGFKQVYDFLYRRHEKKEIGRLIDRLNDELIKNQIPTPTEIYCQPDLKLTSAFLQDKNAATEFNLIEHGIGDYMSFEKNELYPFPFHCLFADEFEAFVNRDITTEQLFPSGAFQEFAEEKFDQWFDQQKNVIQQMFGDGQINIILLQPFEQFLIQDGYWIDFIDACLAHSAQDAHWIIKPHPRQSEAVINRILKLMKERNLTYTMMTQPDLKYVNIEILFHFFGERIENVFSSFSSASFYLPRLYPKIDFNSYFDFSLVQIHQSRTPELYKRHWQQMEALVADVFSADARLNKLFN